MSCHLFIMQRDQKEFLCFHLKKQMSRSNKINHILKKLAKQNFHMQKMDTKFC